MLGWGSIPRRVWRVGTPPFEKIPSLTDYSECMVAIALTLLGGLPFVSNTKKPRVVDSLLLVFSFFYYMIK